MTSRILPALAVGSAILLMTASLPLAQDADPIKQRQEAMKTVGKSAKAIGGMLKGETEFDQAQAAAALAAMGEAVAEFHTYFPEGSVSEESEAAPAIWTNNDDFMERIEKFQASIDAAIESNPQDKEALGATFGEVGQNCKGCHENFRVEKKT